MSTLDTRPSAAFATGVRFDDEMIHVTLADGRCVAAPMEWFPSLRAATTSQRNNWRLIGRGVGIHWDDLDEDLSVAGLLKH